MAEIPLSQDDLWAKALIENVPQKDKPKQKRGKSPVRVFNKEYIPRRWDFRNTRMVEWFEAHGVYLGTHDTKPGRHYVHCPFEDEHSEKKERHSDTIMGDGSPESDRAPFFYCSHGHSGCTTPEAHGQHDLEAVAELWGDAAEYGARRLDEELRQNDDGNSRRFYSYFGERLRYCKQLKTWYLWNDTHWAPDVCDEVVNHVRALNDRLGEEAMELEPKERKAFIQFIHRSSSGRGMHATMTLAQSLVPVRAEALDADPALLNFLNGTLNVETDEFREEHNPQDLLTRVLPFRYDPQADCPVWGNFIYRVTGGDEELMGFLQRAIGYCLTGDVTEKCFFILHGPTDTGKTTFLEAIGRMMGPYAKMTRPSLLLAKREEGIPSDLAMLKGARFVWTSETEEGRRLSAAGVKAMTGGDQITARFMYQDWFTFKPTHKLWLATNHKPVIRETGDAIWNKVKLIPFVVQTAKKDQDRQLLVRLEDEWPGITQWALEGLRQWKALGRRLGTARAVQDATASYEKESNLLLQFLEEECIRGPQEECSTKQLHDAYTEWCRRSGEPPVSLRRFGSMLDENGVERREIHHVMRCFGIRPMNGLERSGLRS